MTRTPTQMQPKYLAIPILPSASVEDTLAFCRRLGFEGKIWDAPYQHAILIRGTVELHLFTQADHNPAESSCYLAINKYF